MCFVQIVKVWELGVRLSEREGVGDGEERERESMRLYMRFVQIVKVWELGLG